MKITHEDIFISKFTTYSAMTALPLFYHHPSFSIISASSSSCAISSEGFV
jgi:hypothetical protein